MAYIIAEPCIGTKDTACVDVCPVDCIHPAKGRTYDDGRPTFDEVPQLYIDPTECIDCGACVDRKSTRLNSSHGYISYAVFCLKKKKTKLLLGIVVYWKLMLLVSFDTSFSLFWSVSCWSYQLLTFDSAKLLLLIPLSSAQVSTL